MAQPRPGPNIIAFPALSRAASAAAGPHIARLVVSDFRCYRREALETDPRPVVLTGPNGAGKTNLLEALSFLAPGRGLRQARLGEVDRRSPSPRDERQDAAARPWAVAVRLAGPVGECEIGTGRDPAAEEGARERRLLRIDGAPQRGLTGLAERLAVLWLTPQMDGLFLDSKSARRRFLDRLVLCFDPGHAGRLNAYELAASERMRLLRGEGPAAQPGWLDALEHRAEAGCEIEPGGGDGSFPRPALALQGEVEDWLSEMPAL